MFRRNRPSPTFRQCVDSRYQYDLVMNGVAALLVVLVPMAALLVSFILSHTDTKYAVIQDYWPKVVLVCCTVEIYVLMIVVYRLFSRLISHSKRDLTWAGCLTAYARDKGCDTSKLAGAVRDLRATEPVTAKFIARALLAAMFAYIVWVMLFAVPVLESLSGGNETFVAAIGRFVIFKADIVAVAYGVGIFLVTMMILTVLVPVMRFPYQHEYAQVIFTRHLVNALDRVGISILPMATVTKRMRFISNAILMFLTGGLWLPFMLFKIFRNMNNHLMNEWVYEAELLKSVESDGMEGFDSEFFNYAPAKLRDGKAHRRANKAFSRMMKGRARSENRMPRILILAELFLIVLCANYILKMIALTAMMSDNIEDYTFTLFTITDLSFDAFVNVALVVMDLYFTMLMIDSLLGLASRRAASWRKVVRSCVTFVIPLWFSALITKPEGISHLFDFNVYATTIVLGLVMMVMILSETIRRYYTPVGYEMPPLTAWIRFAVWGSLVSVSAFEIEAEMDSME